MNLKVLFFLLVYYVLMSIIFIATTGTDNPYTNNDVYLNGTPINGSSISSTEIDTGGLFTIGVSVLRFVGFVGFGIGFPSSLPLWFLVSMIIIQSAISMFTVGFIIDSVWSG